MHIRHHPSTAAALLLAGIAVLNALLGAGPSRFLMPSNSDAGMAPPALGGNARMVLERCRENVAMIHDVHWAFACMANARDAKASGADTADDSPECTLPDDRAVGLNAARSSAENQCMAEALSSERVAGSTAQ